jgi:hypothetical protein
MSVASEETLGQRSTRSLIGKFVLMTISDPWKFGEVHGSGPFRAQVVDVAAIEHAAGGRALLLRLPTPLWFEGNVCEHLIAAPRSADGGLDKLGGGESIPCSFVSISPQGAKSPRPFDLSWWNGWGALSGVIQAAPREAPAAHATPSRTS